MSDQQNQFKDKRKILSVASHLSILFSSSLVSILIPVAIILLSEDEVAIGNAKEALNFCITICILGICFVLLIFFRIGYPLLIFFRIGYPLLILLGIASWIMPIIAIFKILKNPDRVYRYPLILHLL